MEYFLASVCFHGFSLHIWGTDFKAVMFSIFVFALTKAGIMQSLKKFVCRLKRGFEIADVAYNRDSNCTLVSNSAQESELNALESYLFHDVVNQT